MAAGACNQCGCCYSEHKDGYCKPTAENTVPVFRGAFSLPTLRRKQALGPGYKEAQHALNQLFAETDRKA